MTRVRVCPVADLPVGSHVVMDVGPKGVGVFNVGGTLVALRNQCPHAGAPLCKGDVTGTTESSAPYAVEWVRDGEILRCPWHRWEFDILAAATITDPVVRVQRYDVAVEDGVIYVDVPSSSRAREDAT